MTPAIYYVTPVFEDFTTQYWRAPDDKMFDVTSSSIVRYYARVRPESVRGTRYVDGHWGPNAWYVQARGMDAPYLTGKYCPLGWYADGWLQVDSPSAVVSAVVPDPLGMPDDDMVWSAKLKALQNLRGQKVNLGVALAEAKETAGFFANTVNRIDKLLTSAYRRNPKDWLRGVARAGAGRWRKVPQYYLENCYALSPLLSDIDGSCRELADRITGASLLPDLSVTGVVSDKLSVPSTFVTDGNTVCEYPWTGRKLVKVGVNAFVPNFVLQDFNRLGLTNPLEVAWEKVPYSFVIDWLIPVGGWLGTLDVSNYLTFRDGYVTRVVDASSVPSVGPTQNVRWWSLSKVTSGSAWFFQMDRSLLTGIPSLSFPPLRAKLGLDRVAQSLSLLTQTVRSHQKLAGNRS